MRALVGTIGSALVGCQGPQSMLESAGPEAAAIVKLWWVLFGIGLLVLLVVTSLLLIGCFRSYQAHPQPTSHRGLGRALVIGTLATIFLLLVMLVGTYESSQPFAGEPDDAITIEVTGKRWWWAVSYLNEDGDRLFETANEIHIPAGVPVRLRLLSDNVIHSLWVPKLGGKVDLVPGRTNYLWLQADQPGIYRGQCAEFCGIQHAKMSLFVIASPAKDFADWTLAQQRAAEDPEGALARRGRDVFVNAACAKCHTIRGISSVSRIGPDLTHLASRQSLAAGTLPNRRGHLGGWIADPQSAKPGNLMPAVPLVAEDFHALLHYLETLE